MTQHKNINVSFFLFNSGKTSLMFSYCSLFICVGSLRSLDGSSGFPFEKLLTTRIVMFDEPNFATKYTDDFKELLAGQTFDCAKKYKTPQHLHSQPFIILSNNPTIFDMRDDIWIVRIKKYIVDKANFDVSEYMTAHELHEQKIHPLGWIEILKKYEFLN